MQKKSNKQKPTRNPKRIESNQQNVVITRSTKPLLWKHEPFQQIRQNLHFTVDFLLSFNVNTLNLASQTIFQPWIYVHQCNKLKLILNTHPLKFLVRQYFSWKSNPTRTKCSPMKLTNVFYPVTLPLLVGKVSLLTKFTKDILIFHPFLQIMTSWLFPDWILPLLSFLYGVSLWKQNR